MSAAELSHKQLVELWKDIDRAGGARRYVEKELRRKKVFVSRVSPDAFLKMGERDKKSYIAKLESERVIRAPLQLVVWRAYCADHMVHLGQGIHWYDTLDIDRFDPEERQRRLDNFGLPQLESIDAVCEALDLTLPELRWFCYHRDAATTLHYRCFKLPKKTGGERDIWAPMPRLKAIQRWIQLNVVERLPIHGAAHGFVPGRSIHTNATEHTDAAVIVSLDLADFFPTLTFPRVKGLFRKAGYLEGVAILLALLCTEAPRQIVNMRGKKYYIATGPRCLPQGSPASPAITNVACVRLDRRLTGFAKKYGWRYTRYADDLTFSWPSSNKNKPLVGALLRAVGKMVEDEGFQLRKDKTHVMRPHDAQKVTGLVVNGQDKDARTPRQVKRLLRSAIHNLSNGKPLPDDGHDLHSLIGLAAFVNMSEPELGRRYLDQLQAFVKSDA